MSGQPSARAIGLALALTATISAQQTWIVDPGGSGHFTSLTQAIAQAGAGDTLLLRGGGTYSSIPYPLVDKPLSILGVAPGRPTIASPLTVDASALPGTCTLAGLDIDSLHIESPTTIEDVAMFSCTIDATRASLHRCTVGSATNPAWGRILVSNDSDTVITGSNLYGGAVFPSGGWGCNVYPGAPAIEIDGGTMTLADCLVVGAPSGTVVCTVWNPGTYTTAPSEAIGNNGGVLRLTDCALATHPGASASVVSNGTVFADPSVSFSPAYAPTSVFLPGTGGTGAPPGGIVTCHAKTGPGLPAAVVASLGFHAPTVLPEGIAWIDPALFVVLAIGTTDSAGMLATTIPLPPTAPRGFPLTVQSVAANGPGAPLTAGTPVLLHVL